ncbi:MAG: nitrilase-related carbon-nitrogen hydrolase [Verrucomicrobiota bacterium]
MNILKPSAKPSGWGKSFLLLALAVACFHAAYTSIHFPAAGLLIFGYAYGLVRLADQPTVRRAFYFGLATGFLCCAPQLFFFWNIFSAAAIVLWLVLAFWIGLFAAIVCGSIWRWGKVKAAWLIPIVWTGIEYFRSELYYLKFSWLNVGYALPSLCCNLGIGMYGIGFLIFGILAINCYQPKKQTHLEITLILFLLWVFAELLLPSHAETKSRHIQISIVGVQMEFPPENVIPKMLDQALAKNTNAPIFVLSEYTLDGPVPDSLKNWCREHSRFLVVGGKDPVGADNFYDTAFVIGTNGDIVFKQVKSVPIQFFKDGLPAPEQKVWDSPWGKIGICVCYDLSYTRVTDELVRQGAQLLIVPTMDVADWGRHQHEIHSRVAPVRAAEYGLPIFRVASSGISQAVTGGGYVVAQTSMPGSGEIFSAQLRLPMRGALPLDRYLAPFCVAVTGIVTAVLLFLASKDKRAKPNH